MDLEALPSVIDEARLVENVAAQSTVVEACLQRILGHTAPGSLRKPHPERLVLANAGFRPVGRHLYQTEVIRTSIDRPDVSICVRPLPRGKTDSFEALHFLLDKCIGLDGTATPEQIPKTIVFIDGRGLL